MERLGHHWKKTPPHIRKTLVLIVGMGLVIASPFTGVLPGPGGIPVFLVGVAILASEFEWAKRFKQRISGPLELFTSWFKAHKLLGMIILAVLFTLLATFSYYLSNVLTN